MGPGIHRCSKLLLGLFCFGFGSALMKRGDLGLAPWDVFHDGISFQTGIWIGTASILVGFFVLLLWIPLRMRPGLGTVLNMLLVGYFTNLSLEYLGTVEHVLLRVLLLVLGMLFIGLGSALYLGAHLGAGPRDGLMVGLHQKTGLPVGKIRTFLEILMLVAGFLLGGRVGFGTIFFAFAIGPIFHFALRWSEQKINITEQTGNSFITLR